jgi:Excalibur calcium-binding domain
MTQELPDKPSAEDPQPTYKPGDVVNGYILTEHLGWQPVEEAPTPKSGRAWWRSTWTVATAAGILALFAGIAIGSSQSTAQTEELAAIQDRLHAAQAEVKRLRAAAATADAQLAQRESEVKAREAAVAEKEQAVKAREDAVAQKEQELAAREQAVAASEQQLANKATPKQPSPTVQTTTNASSADPRFGTCAQAKAAGFGPYRSGVDPEYDWYRDQDSDGIVCE